MDENITSFEFENTTDFSSDFSTYVISALETLPPKFNLTTPHKTQLLLYDILIPTLGSLIIVLNFAVVLSSGLILKRGLQPRSTYLFLGNVAMCDLVTGIAVLFGQLYPKNYRGQITCGIQLGLIVSSTMTSIYSVGLIAIDRYLYIIHGIQYQQWVYPTRARLCILITWIIGGVVGFLPVMGWAGDTLNGKICWFIKLVPPNLVVLTCIIGLIPILIVVILYSIILYHALKKVIQLRRAGNTRNAIENTTTDNSLRIFVGRKNNEATEQPENPQQNKGNIFKRMFIKKPNVPVDLKAPTKTKAITVVLLVTGSFVVTWVPYFAASFIYAQCDPKITPAKCKNLQVLIASPLAILGFCNSLLNPIIYAWWHKGFRSSIKRIFNRNKLNVAGSPSSGTTTRSTSRSNNTKKMSASTSVSHENDGTKMNEIELELDTRM